MPVHFNAGWQVRADRRDIERPKGGGEVAEWHMFLMSQMLAPAYAQALVSLTRSEETWWQAGYNEGSYFSLFNTFIS